MMIKLFLLLGSNLKISPKIPHEVARLTEVFEHKRVRKIRETSSWEVASFEVTASCQNQERVIFLMQST